MKHGTEVVVVALEWCFWGGGGAEGSFGGVCMSGPLSARVKAHIAGATLKFFLVALGVLYVINVTAMTFVYVMRSLWCYLDALYYRAVAWFIFLA